MAISKTAAKKPADVWDGSVPPAATAVVKRIEGFYAKPYDDNGSLPGGTMTIGYGSIRDAQERPITWNTPPITEAQAEVLLMRDMRGAASDVRQRVLVPLRVCEAAALVSWTYNLGGGNLGSSTMLKRLNLFNEATVMPKESKQIWVFFLGVSFSLALQRWGIHAPKHFFLN